MASQNQVPLYVNDERLQKIAAIRDELSRRAGVELSRNAVICRAIDDLFLTVCPLKETDGVKESQVAA
jgi:hypothetical protein